MLIARSTQPRAWSAEKLSRTSIMFSVTLPSLNQRSTAAASLGPELAQADHYFSHSRGTLDDASPPRP